MISRRRGSGSGFRHGLFGTSGSGFILIGAPGAPMSNWPVTSEVLHCQYLSLLD